VRFLTRSDVRTSLLRYGVKPKKRAGQSFLTDDSIAARIVDAAGVVSTDSVLEVGGGLGVLTERLADRAGRVYVIEIEPGLVKALHDLLDDRSNVEIIQGDALEIELPAVKKTVSNIPYSISSDITFRLLNELELESAVMMYQQEYAERLFAEPGSGGYSRLTIDVRYLVNVEQIMRVPRRFFYPVPAVDSLVVRMTPRKNGPFAWSREAFYETIHGIYSYPNKQLKRALRIWLQNLGQEENTADRILERCEGRFSGEERLRRLTLHDLVVLTDAVLRVAEEESIPGMRRRNA
jgi:16S rRNA (adenine1518-N6/adenine1519-N6)-dimethyltransferase